MCRSGDPREMSEANSETGAGSKSPENGLGIAERTGVKSGGRMSETGSRGEESGREEEIQGATFSSPPLEGTALLAERMSERPRGC